MTDVTVRPMSSFPKKETPTGERKSGNNFHSSIDATLKLLRRELDLIGAEGIVLELDYTRLDLRVSDGWPKTDARPKSPRVVVSFHLPGVGPIRYPCDTYASWHANVRAIALSLEALRAVDRHGVTTGKREQYRGFTALPPGRDGGAEYMSPEEAAGLLITWDPTLGDRVSADALPSLLELMTTIPEFAAGVARRALAAVHPDSGGKRDDFERAERARAVLTAHHGGSLG